MAERTLDLVLVGASSGSWPPTQLAALHTWLWLAGRCGFRGRRPRWAYSSYIQAGPVGSLQLTGRPSARPHGSGGRGCLSLCVYYLGRVSYARSPPVYMYQNPNPQNKTMPCALLGSRSKASSSSSSSSSAESGHGQAVAAADAVEYIYLLVLLAT